MSEQPNAAVVPEPPGPQQRTYRVTGTAQSTLSHKPGETFTALLDPVQEGHLIAGGAIEIVPDPPVADPPVADSSAAPRGRNTSDATTTPTRKEQ